MVACRLLCRRTFLARILIAGLFVYIFTLATTFIPSQMQTENFQDDQRINSDFEPFVNALQRNVFMGNIPQELAKKIANDPPVPVPIPELPIHNNKASKLISAKPLVQMRVTYKLPGCGEGVQRPQLNPSQTSPKWNTMEEEKTYIYSAFLDQRGDSFHIRIVGVSLSGFLNPHYQCLIWYDDQDLPDTQTANMEIIPEGHSKRFVAVFYTCTARRALNGSVPKAVSMVTDVCFEATNIMRLTSTTSELPGQKYDFTVCVTPMNFRFNDINQLVEMVEVNRMFGANHFIFYNYSSGPNVTSYLLDYERENIVEVLKWDLPMKVETWPPDPENQPEIHYFGQLAALNDCLYRTMATSKYAVFTDLDEFIVPKSPTTQTWQQMMQLLHGPNKANSAVFIFRNTFFRTDLAKNVEAASNATLASLELRTQLITMRERIISPHFARSKYFVVPSLVDIVGVHMTYRTRGCNGPECIQQVSEQIGLVHHYRSWPGGNGDVVEDKTMWQFREQIVGRTLTQHQQHRLAAASV